MNATPLTRRITATLSGPLVAAGIMLGSMVVGEVASAGAEPTAGGHSTSV